MQPLSRSQHLACKNINPQEIWGAIHQHNVVACGAAEVDLDFKARQAVVQWVAAPSGSNQEFGAWYEPFGYPPRLKRVAAHPVAVKRSEGFERVAASFVFLI